MRFEAGLRRTTLLHTDAAGTPCAARNGHLTLSTDDGVTADVAVTTTDTVTTIGEMLGAVFLLMAAGPMLTCEVRSAVYVPTPEQSHMSALCAALAANGVTERDVIEHLFRENQRLAVELVRALETRPVQPLVVSLR